MAVESADKFCIQKSLRYRERYAKQERQEFAIQYAKKKEYNLAQANVIENGHLQKDFANRNSE
jgi:hypothetical protein